MDFSNIKNMHTALNAYTLRNETINKNLANVNTPNYKREVVSFEEYLDKSKNKYQKDIDNFNLRIEEIKREIYELSDIKLSCRVDHIYEANIPVNTYCIFMIFIDWTCLKGS